MVKVIKHPFNAGDYVVYPAHGVGKISDVAKHKVAGSELELVVVNFDKDRMTLRVPVSKIGESGLRALASEDIMGGAIETLKGKAKVKRTMWSRRAQEYEAKINSGDPVAIAEVVRDLHRNDNIAEQSYSERQIYEQALGRLANEYAALKGMESAQAINDLTVILSDK